MLKYFWLINIFFVVVGCSFFGKERIKPSSLLPFEETVVLEKAWTFDNKARLEAGDISLVTVPSVLGDNVIVPAGNGVVTILKLATGQIKERIELGFQSLSQIGVEAAEDAYNFAFVSTKDLYCTFRYYICYLHILLSKILFITSDAVVVKNLGATL